MLIKVAAVQSELGKKLSIEERLLIFKHRADFVCLPEYCLINKETPDFARAALDIRENIQYLSALSETLSTCIIGGSVVEADYDSLYNSSYLFNCGKVMGKYRKLNPVDGEIDKGILPGDKIFITDIDGVRIALLICADALNIWLFDLLGRENIDIIFIPTTSPLRAGEKKAEKEKRDHNIFLRAAMVSSSYIVKSCGVGTIFGKPLQGRSLIASPWGLLKRVESHAESSELILTAVLDIDELREFRDKKRRLKTPEPEYSKQA